MDLQTEHMFNILTDNDWDEKEFLQCYNNEINSIKCCITNKYRIIPCIR